MANPQLGEIDFEVQGVKYTWCFSVQAMCCLEEHLDRGVLDITEQLQSWLPPTHIVEGKLELKPESADEKKSRMFKVRMGLIRALFWAGLQDHHPELDMKAAGQLMKAYGGMIPAFGMIVKGVMLAQAEAEQQGSSAAPLQGTAQVLN